MNLIHRYKSLVHILASLFLGMVMVAFLSACDNDSETPVDPLVGQYKFVSAVLTESTSYPALSMGTNVTNIIGGGLFSAITCTDASNTVIELKASKELFFVCINESKAEVAGTWSSNSTQTELTLNFNDNFFPLAFSLKILGVALVGNTLTGKAENLPLPGTLVNVYEPSVPANIPLVLFTVDMTFQKQ